MLTFISNLPKTTKPQKKDAVNFARYFILCYCTGKGEVQTVANYVQGLIDYLRVDDSPDGCIINTDLFGEVGDVLGSSVDKVIQLQAAPAVVDNPVAELSFLVSVGRAKIAPISIKQYGQKTEETINEEYVQKWIDFLFSSLDKYGSQTDQTLYYLGFLCLTLIRIIIKDAGTLQKHMPEFVSKRFSALWRGYFKLATLPNRQFYRLLRSGFVKQGENYSMVMTKMLYSLYKPPSTKADQIRSVLRAGSILLLS